MTKARSSMFGGNGPPEQLEVDGFKPGPIRRPDVPAARQAAEAGGFISREPAAPRVDTQRRHRTGRTEQLNLKVSPEFKGRFAAMADAAGESLNVTFERAVSALERDV